MERREELKFERKSEVEIGVVRPPTFVFFRVSNFGFRTSGSNLARPWGNYLLVFTSSEVIISG
jgi:hypothetical protein